MVQVPNTPYCTEFVRQQTQFLYQFFQASEASTRSMEISALVATATVFAWLATFHKDTEKRIPPAVWWIPSLVTLLAAIRSVTLGIRQGEIVALVAKLEGVCLGELNEIGWAQGFSNHGPWLILSAVVFYVTLLVFDVSIARRYQDFEKPTKGRTHTAHH
jgi:hypothetical protein